MEELVVYRNIIIASISLAALGALPVFIPNIVAKGHCCADFLLTVVLV